MDCRIKSGNDEPAISSRCGFASRRAQRRPDALWGCRHFVNCYAEG
jgi:hypothetical protein